MIMQLYMKSMNSNGTTEFKKVPMDLVRNPPFQVDKLVDVKLCLWDIADHLSKNKTMDLDEFNRLAWQNGIDPKKEEDK